MDIYRVAVRALKCLAAVVNADKDFPRLNPDQGLRMQKDEKFFRKVANSYMDYCLLYRVLIFCFEQASVSRPQSLDGAFRQILEALIGRLIELKQSMLECPLQLQSLMDELIARRALNSDDLKLPMPTVLVAQRVEQMQDKKARITLCSQLSKRSASRVAMAANHLDAQKSQKKISQVGTKQLEKQKHEEDPKLEIQKNQQIQCKETIEKHFETLNQLLNDRQTFENGCSSIRSVDVKSLARELLSEEHAATIIQAAFRGFLERQILRQLGGGVSPIMVQQKQSVVGPLPVLGASDCICRQPRAVIGRNNYLLPDILQNACAVSAKDGETDLDCNNSNDFRRRSISSLKRNSVHFNTEEPRNLMQESNISSSPNINAVVTRRKSMFGNRRRSSGFLPFMRDRRDTLENKRSWFKKEMEQLLFPCRNFRQSECTEVASNDVTNHKSSNSKQIETRKSSLASFDVANAESDADAEATVEDETRKLAGKLASVMRLSASEKFRITIRDRLRNAVRAKIEKANNNKVFRKLMRRKSPMTEEKKAKFMAKQFRNFSMNQTLIASNSIDVSSFVEDKAVLRSQWCHGIDDVQKLLTEFVIFPMVSPRIHAHAPLIKSVLISSPSGCGKSTMVHLAASTIGANLLRINTATLKGTPEHNKRLVANIWKFSQMDTPSIIWFDKVDACFARTKLKGAPIRKAFRNLCKKIQPGQRIILLVTVRYPQQIIRSYFDLSIEIHAPTHRTRFAYLQKRLSTVLQQKKIQTMLSLDLLTHLTNDTEGFSFRQMERLISKVFTDSYVQLLNHGQNMRVEEFRKAIKELKQDRNNSCSTSTEKCKRKYLPRK